MGDKNKTDHGLGRGHVLVAPHERAAIFTIRNPRARGFPADSGHVLHCSKSASGAAITWGRDRANPSATMLLFCNQDTVHMGNPGGPQHYVVSFPWTGRATAS